MVSSRRSAQRRGPGYNRSAESRPHAAKPPMLQPSHRQVVAAIRSLLDDEVQPLGRILRKRCGELAAAQLADASAEAPDVDPRYLQRLCEESAEIRVASENGGEWAAALEGHPATFVDFYDPADPYPSELWIRAAQYFESLDAKHMVMPGGRYACARLLLSRGLPFLAGCSLGQVCHIIQLAVSQRKILGYQDGDTVPYRFSQSRAKEDCAAQQQPLSTSSDIPVATWEVLRQCLKEILESTPGPRPGCVTVSNVKRIFRLRYEVELSETALGYSKVTDLFQDHRLHDTCLLRLQGRGYAVVQVMHANDGETCDKACSADLCQASCNGGSKIKEQVRAEEFVQPSLINPAVYRFDESLSLERVSSMARGTFIHFPQPAQAATSRMQRSHSLPKDFNSLKDPLEADCHALMFLPRRVGADDMSPQSRQCGFAIPDLFTTGAVARAGPSNFIELGEHFLSLGAHLSDDSTPRSSPLADGSRDDVTPSQRRLSKLRASGQATLEALAGEVSPSISRHAGRTADSDWIGGLERWRSESDIACHHIFVADAHGDWMSSGHVGQDVFMVFPGLDGGLHWD